MIIGSYLGPYLPGGLAEGVLLAVGSSLVALAIAASVGGFGWRARNVTSTPKRLAARFVLITGPLAALAVFMGLAAYRVHLESGQPIVDWLQHASVGTALFVLLNCAVFGVTAWKFQGGTRMPWTSYWGEAEVDRRWQLARLKRERMEAFHRDQLITLYDQEIATVRKFVSSEEDKLQGLRAAATSVEGHLARERMAVHVTATRAIADLQLYESTFREHAPEATFVEIAIEEPAFPPAKEQLDAAFAAADARLLALRHEAADLDRRLAHMRDEALGNFVKLVADLRSRRVKPAAQPAAEPDWARVPVRA